MRRNLYFVLFSTKNISKYYSDVKLAFSSNYAIACLKLVYNWLCLFSEMSNDFSVTQEDNSITQFDICTNANGTSYSKRAIDSGCPEGQKLIPGFLYSFKVSSAELGKFVPPQKVPEPTATAGLMLLGLSGLWLKRRR